MIFFLDDLERNPNTFSILAVAKSVSDTPVTVFSYSLHAFECMSCAGHSLNNITRLSSLDFRATHSIVICRIVFPCKSELIRTCCIVHVLYSYIFSKEKFGK